MNTLRPDLFDTDFEQLVGLIRALIPKYAPEWTDHNLHDPGIMLGELAAWTAEAQIYSLARLRRDERWAYGALLGFAPRGPLPAGGIVWPKSPDTPESRPAWGNGIVLADEAQVTAEHQPQAPKFRLSHRINLTGAGLVGVESRLRDGRILNHRATNERPGAAFYPFGERADSGDRLVLTFKGSLLAPGDPSAIDAVLSLGVRVPAENTGTSTPPPASRPEIPDVSQPSASAAGLVATLLDGQIRYPLPVKADSTNGFQRTGVILLRLHAVPSSLGDRFSIEIENRSAGFAGRPRILYIQPNVLPIEQRLTMTKVIPDWSNELPDQTLRLEEAGVLYSESQPCPRLGFSTANGVAEWTRIEDFAAAGPEDTVFLFDPEIPQIRFGNGLNGRIPPKGAALQLSYEVTDGPAGNLPSGVAWTVQGLDKPIGTNLDPIAGGFPALDLLELRRLARESARTIHAIVTSDDLEQAALALPDLRVARAQELSAPDRGTRCSALFVTRTLVVLRARLPVEDSAFNPESPRWLAEVQRQLAGRLPLGERLRVIGPDYLPLRVEATLLSRPGYDPETIASQALDVVAKYFLLVPRMPGDEVWPLGRPVEMLDVRARLLNIDGVARIKACALLWADEPVAAANPVFSNTFLPLLRIPDSRLVVERLTAESGS